MLGDRATLARVGPILDTYAADFTTWLATIPPEAQISAAEEMHLRALRLAITNAANRTAIWTYFADTVSAPANAHRTAVAVPASVYTGLLARLDAVLAQAAPAAREVISYCGAAGADRATSLADAARMARHGPSYRPPISIKRSSPSALRCRRRSISS